MGRSARKEMVPEVGKGSRGPKKGPPSKRRRADKGKGMFVVTPGAPNPDYAGRMRRIRNRKFLVERGINMEELAGTFVTEAVRILGWGRYIQQPNPGTAEIVKEFYASMNPELFYFEGEPVLVRNNGVVISAARINEWLGTPNLPDLVEGLPNHEFFSNPSNGNLCADLKITGCPVWNSTSCRLKYLRIKVDAAFWYIFFSRYLKPTSHRTFVSPEIARLLFCARNHYPMDIGQIIMKEIYETGKSFKGLLPFPCLITHFCAEAGIDVYRQCLTVLKNAPLIGKRAYNFIAKKRGMRPIDDEEGDGDGMRIGMEDLEDEDDPDYNEQNLEGDADAEVQGSTLDDILGMLRAINTKLDGVFATQQDHGSQLAQLSNQSQAIQKALASAGVHIGYQRRGGQSSQQGDRNRQPDL